MPQEKWGEEAWRNDNSWIYEEQAGRIDRESGRVPGGPKVGGGCGTCLYVAMIVLILAAMLIGVR